MGLALTQKTAFSVASRMSHAVIMSMPVERQAGARAESMQCETPWADLWKLVGCLQEQQCTVEHPAMHTTMHTLCRKEPALRCRCWNGSQAAPLPHLQPPSSPNPPPAPTQWPCTAAMTGTGQASNAVMASWSTNTNDLAGRGKEMRAESVNTGLNKQLRSGLACPTAVVITCSLHTSIHMRT